MDRDAGRDEQSRTFVCPNTRRQRKKLLLIGHLDTVFEADSPFQTFERDGDMAYAPGGNDMKGGNVVILYALKGITRIESFKRRWGITVAYTGDEERTGKPCLYREKTLLLRLNRVILPRFRNCDGF